ncbi:MAG TPA: alanine racemase [Acidimicrobiales bacterium]|jgi:alanine racemase|nr:alanine racemase [Acidimicrobiales bacterium]
MADSAPVRAVHALPDADEPGDEVTMAQGRSRPAWAEIDLAAVAHNARVLARLAAPAQLCAVVKAHGYGHGGPAVARAALAGGAQRLAVALVDEGVELRQHGVAAPVLLLSECGPDAVETALAYGLTPTLYSSESIAAFAAAGRAAGHDVPVHLKVDTGMHRVGAAPGDLVALAGTIVSDPWLQLEGVWTHLPVADGEAAEDRSYTEGQLDLFDRLVAELAAAGIEAPLVHAANTAGAVAFPRSRHDMVRCGIGLYGYLPGVTVRRAFEEQAAGETLRPAMALKARVVTTRELEAGERPSYGRLRPLAARSVVATVPIGYADGVPRSLFDAGYEVLIGGVRRPLAGAVTMDQIMVDCGDDTSVQSGDEVVLLGTQGDETITADDWADMLGTISYEVVCGVGPRMPRTLVNRPAGGD